MVPGCEVVRESISVFALSFPIRKTTRRIMIRIRMIKIDASTRETTKNLLLQRPLQKRHGTFFSDSWCS